MHKVVLQSTLKREEIYFHFFNLHFDVVSDRHRVNTAVLVLWNI